MYRTVKTTDKPAASSGNSYCLALTHFSLFFFQAALFSNFFHYTNQTKSSLSHFFSFNLNPLWIKENVPICIHALQIDKDLDFLFYSFFFFFLLLKGNQTGLVKKTSPRSAMRATAAYAHSPIKEEPLRGLCNRKLTSLLLIYGAILQGAIVYLSLFVCVLEA